MEAPTDSTVLIQGETGTGKELVARGIHQVSPRRDRLLVSVHCAALAPNLVASELFGHEAGAFTGATRRRVGRFELAHRGTLFLDEIAELALTVQAKLLRVIETGEYEPVGGNATSMNKSRIIAASNLVTSPTVRHHERRVEAFCSDVPDVVKGGSLKFETGKH